MLTFEKILNVFASYLMQDKGIDVIKTRHGYTVLMWNSGQQNWCNAEFCATPEKMLELLQNSYGMYMEEKYCGGKRNLTETEKAWIEAEQSKMNYFCLHN